MCIVSRGYVIPQFQWKRSAHLRYNLSWRCLLVYDGLMWIFLRKPATMSDHIKQKVLKMDGEKGGKAQRQHKDTFKSESDNNQTNNNLKAGKNEENKNYRNNNNNNNITNSNTISRPQSTALILSKTKPTIIIESFRSNLSNYEYTSRRLAWVDFLGLFPVHKTLSYGVIPRIVVNRPLKNGRKWTTI